MLDADGKRPTDRREEEMACDVWAREFMTVKIGEYVKKSGASYEKILRKRSMGFALASLILHDITPVLDHGGTTEYFSLSDRMKAILGNTALPDDDRFWIFTASLLLGVFRQKGTSFDTAVRSPKKLSEYLVNQI